MPLSLPTSSDRRLPERRAKATRWGRPATEYARSSLCRRQLEALCASCWNTTSTAFIGSATSGCISSSPRLRPTSAAFRRNKRYSYSPWASAMTLFDFAFSEPAKSTPFSRMATPFGSLQQLAGLHQLLSLLLRSPNRFLQLCQLLLYNILCNLLVGQLLIKRPYLFQQPHILDYDVPYNLKKFLTVYRNRHL